MNIQIEDLVPKWLLWICAIPFMILLIPIGIVYTLMLLYFAIRGKQRFESYKHDIFYAIGRPGFYVGLIIAILLTASIKIPFNKIIRNEPQLRTKRG